MVGSSLAALEPRPRLVDWSILACVLVEAVTGLVSLGAGAVAQWPLFWVHRIVGLTLFVLLFFKLRRVKPRLRRGRWDRATPLSVLTAVVALAALATGVAWVLGVDADLAFWTLLNVHIGLGLLLVPLVVLHLRARYRPVRRVDFEGRRTALQYGALLVGGALVARSQELVNRVAGTEGERRRFTGSKPVDGEGFPVTSWVADDPDPVDLDAWRLRVDGLVESPLTLSDETLDTRDQRRALLDCTSGWYTVEDWRGVSLGTVLDEAGVDGGARWVTVHSVTGYRWSFPLTEARGFLLATHVGGERLSHGHGFPLRLVAPQRRGFQWVKWVTRIELRRGRDTSQYLATLVSGVT
ncbi:molybdopterin-dependent oxidoreductase [Salinigranum halophilum]|uniref:molybdopterin-dependent oxidoreductase n=1 Tax=Salinigranum halophilum TaxID=2565931 RepID=UPI0010A8A68F|nr:molybdopterin-dependent oxidoreductase [Salinigranum halophilum]